MTRLQQFTINIRTPEAQAPFTVDEIEAALRATYPGTFAESGGATVTAAEAGHGRSRRSEGTVTR